MQRRPRKGCRKSNVMDDLTKIKLPDGFDHQAFLSIDSTNKEAIRKIEAGAMSGLWITASEQTGGRGRGGREWVSKPGNLYCSLIQETDGDIQKSSQLSFVAALAVRDTIASFINSEDVKCKWPNDVLVSGMKICGILLESYRSDRKSKNYIIIGVGINVEQNPDLTIYATTHLNEQANDNFSHIDVFSILAQKMSEWVSIWQKQGFSVIRKAWLDHCKGLGELITVRLPNKQLVGRFIDLDATGALMLDTDGETKLIHSGDVFFTN